MREIDFELRGEFITLDALLKATGLAESGGRAKAMVAAGQVQVDGASARRKLPRRPMHRPGWGAFARAACRAGIGRLGADSR
jgi:hypothetical protein